MFLIRLLFSNLTLLKQMTIHSRTEHRSTVFTDLETFVLMLKEFVFVTLFEISRVSMMISGKEWFLRMDGGVRNTVGHPGQLVLRTHTGQNHYTVRTLLDGGARHLR